VLKAENRLSASAIFFMFYFYFLFLFFSISLTRFSYCHIGNLTSSFCLSLKGKNGGTTRIVGGFVLMGFLPSLLLFLNPKTILSPLISLYCILSKSLLCFPTKDLQPFTQKAVFSFFGCFLEHSLAFPYRAFPITIFSFFFFFLVLWARKPPCRVKSMQAFCVSHFVFDLSPFLPLFLFFFFVFYLFKMNPRDIFSCGVISFVQLLKWISQESFLEKGR